MVLMKKIVFFLIIISSYAFAQGQYKLVKTLELKYDFFTTDNQGNIYVVNANELAKYDKTGKQLYKYSNKNLGNIDFVDVSNQLKILLFYKNFTQAVFLDNTLSMSGTPLSFDQMGYQQVQLACTSHNNNIWVYDQQSFSLIRLNAANEETQRTGNLNNLLNIELQPVSMIEYDNKVFLNNPSTGILIFDIYGTYYKTIPLKQVKSFQPLGDYIYYKSEEKIKAYNIKTTEEKEFSLPLTDFDSFSLQIGVLVLGKKGQIAIFSEE